MHSVAEAAHEQHWQNELALAQAREHDTFEGTRGAKAAGFSAICSSAGGLPLRHGYLSIRHLMLKRSVGRLALASTRSLAGTSIRPPVSGYGAWRSVADATALSRCTAAST